MREDNGPSASILQPGWRADREVDGPRKTRERPRRAPAPSSDDRYDDQDACLLRRDVADRRREAPRPGAAGHSRPTAAPARAVAAGSRAPADASQRTRWLRKDDAPRAVGPRGETERAFRLGLARSG